MDIGRPVWPGLHRKKAHEAAREMERELGLMVPTPSAGKRLVGLNRTPKGASVRRPHIPNLGRKVASHKSHGKKSGGGAPMEPVHPDNGKKWSAEAVDDWKKWGHIYTRQFFTKYPELKQ